MNMKCRCHDTIEEHIRELVDAAPPLTDEQKAKLALLLMPDS